jgi:hypothetical protein
MVTKLLALSSGRALARPKAKSLASQGLALINKALNVDMVQAMVDAERFNREQDAAPYLGEGINPAFLDRAKPMHARWLPKIARAVEVSDLLLPLRAPLGQAQAGAMLAYLFHAMGKRRGDDATAKLLACTDMFSAASNSVGESLGLWKAAPRDPLVLAVAIKQLMASKVYEPAESELREALAKVKQRIGVQGWYVDQWISKLDRADAIVFACDRPAWEQAYAQANSDVVRQMRCQLELKDEGPSEDEDEDGNPEFPPSPRWQALHDLIEAATCKTKPAKKTRNR